MGHTIEMSSPTILEKLLALTIQRDAVKGVNDSDAENKSIQLEQRRAELLKWVGDDSPLPENVLDDFFKVFFDKGEVAALTFAKIRRESN